MIPVTRRKRWTMVPPLRAAGAWTSLALVLLTAACAQTPGQVATTERRDRIESWQKLCDDRGFVRGTSDYAACVEGYDKAAYNPPPLPPSALK